MMGSFYSINLLTLSSIPVFLLLLLLLLQHLNLLSLTQIFYYLLKLPLLLLLNLPRSQDEEEEKIPPTHHFVLPGAVSGSGRQISYSIYNPGGPGYRRHAAVTAFYLHGTPSSHHEAFLLASSARERNLRVIAPSRPGFGGSTFHPGSTLLDYAGDVLALADHLGVQRFGIIAASGGTPFAFACRSAIPRDRLVGIAVVSGIYDTKGLGTEGMQWGSRVMMRIAQYRWGRWVLAWGIDRQFAGLLGPPVPVPKVPEEEEKALVEVDADKKLREMVESGMDETEKNVWEEQTEEMRRAVVMSLREGVKYGGKAAAWEMKLLGGHWGFEFGPGLVERKGELVMWHGDRDENVPVGMARRAKGVLGDKADLRVVEGQGHGTLTRYVAGEVCQEIVGMLKRG